MKFQIRISRMLFLVMGFLPAVFLQVRAQESVLIQENILTVKTTGTAFLGSGLTEEDAKTLAINDAKRTALEQTGTYLESHTTVLNYQLVKDEIITYTGGVLKTEVLSEKRELVDNTFAYIVEIEATIDTKVLNDRIREIKSDEDLKSELEAERERNKELEAQIADLGKDPKPENKEKLSRIANTIRANEWLEKALAQRDPATVIQYATKAVEIDPQSPRAYMLRGLYHTKNKNYQRALEDYTKAIHLAPKDPRAYRQRAVIYRLMGKRREARRDERVAKELTDNARRASGRR